MTPASGSVSRRRLGATLALLAGLAAVGIAGIAKADAGSTTFEEASRAFAEGRYPDAVDAFEALVHKRGWSAPVLYNLANAYAKEGRVGRAVLNYERARLLAPSDSDISTNLALARATAGLPMTVRPWYHILARLLSRAAWTALAVTGLWLACVAFAAARKRRSRPLGYAAAVAALAGMMSIAAVAVLDRNLDDAVVVARKSAPVRLSPFDTAAVETTVGEGEELTVVGRHGDFVRLRDGHGRAGWVESAAVQLIVPRHS